MSNILIDGGKPLIGTVTVSGAKNSALKIIAAALFSNENVVLDNVPQIGNITNDLEIVTALGGSFEWISKNKLKIDPSGIHTSEIPIDLGSKYRTAALYAASLVYRFGKATLPIPGGCKIGLRPMNRWVETWQTLGIDVANDDNYFYLEARNIKPGTVNFKVNTHMGTDNAILFSMFIPGETIILNAAEEPEVDDLINFVNSMGADVTRIEPRKIRIVGKNTFYGTSFSVMEDRNEVVTFAVAALVTNGNLVIKGVDRKNLLAFTNVLTKIGAKFEISEDELRIWRAGEKLSPTDVMTAPYPGFMTDWQPLVTLLLTQCIGTSTVYDSVYWDRFGYTKELNRMGCDIDVLKPSELGKDLIISEDTYDLVTQGEPAVVARINNAPSKLKGVKLLIPDLRAGATLVLAALAADGKSELVGFDNVTRGYEDFAEKLKGLGAVLSVD
ncbi:UDP-N-acetylglucosamine 1-carboxyvinyltransferase [candidate division WWE3 bacterium]|nr:UDP-N-acetylglucosamine 1-carboxyvinyltransferase [candidate division WWE3 bacterium]